MALFSFLKIINVFSRPKTKESVNSEAGFVFSEKFHVEWYWNPIFPWMFLKILKLENFKILIKK